MASSMIKALLTSGLIVAQATAAVATPIASGIDSNRAALGLPVDARASSCTTVAGDAASCGTATGASDLVGSPGLALILALSALAAVAIGVAATSHGHHHGSNPVSP